MKVINVDIEDEIIFKSVLDTDTGVLKGVSSVLNIPTGNYNNLILNFNFKNTCLCDKFNMVCSFCINGETTIDMKIGKITVTGVAEYNNACYIPSEVLEKPCYFKFGIYGIAFDDNEKVVQRLSLFPVKNMVSKGSYDPNSKEHLIPTPTLFEQYFSKVDVANAKLVQLEEICDEKVMVYKKYESTYIASAGDTVIPVNITNFSSLFSLIVDKNGTVLIKDTDYTINYEAKKITLSNAVSSDETVIHFIGFASVVGSTQDITDLITTVIGENSITADEIEWDNILNKPTLFNPPVASATRLGGVKVGDYLTIGTDGTLNANGDYEELENIPKINNVPLKGDKSNSDLGVADRTHTHTKSEVTDLVVPTKVSELENDKIYATENFVKNEIARARVEGTSAEIDLSGFASQDDLLNKVDKIEGYSLVSDTEISRLATLENYDDTNILESINSINTLITGIGTTLDDINGETVGGS